MNEIEIGHEEQPYTTCIVWTVRAYETNGFEIEVNKQTNKKNQYTQLSQRYSVFLR